MFNYIPEIAAFGAGAVAVGFGLGYWRYHKNKVARAADKAKTDFDALVQKVKDQINPPSA